MTKVTVFYLISSKFLSTFFWEPHFFPIYLTKIPRLLFIWLLNLITGFLDFLDLKTGFFRRKKIFLRLCRPKNWFFPSQLAFCKKAVEGLAAWRIFWIVQWSRVVSCGLMLRKVYFPKHVLFIINAYAELSRSRTLGFPKICEKIPI